MSSATWYDTNTSQLRAVELRRLAQRGLVLTGASEVRRLYCFIVAVLHGLSFPEYVTLQEQSRAFLEGDGRPCDSSTLDALKDLPGIHCNAGNNKTAAAYEGHGHERVWFLWYPAWAPYDASRPWHWTHEGDPPGPALEVQRVMGRNGSVATVLWGVPMSHFLYFPTQRVAHEFCVLVGGDLPSTHADPSWRMHRAFKSHIEAYIDEGLRFFNGTGARLVLVGAPAYCLDPTHQTSIRRTDGAWLEGLSTFGELFAFARAWAGISTASEFVRHVPAACVCNRWTNRSTASWASACDPWLQSNCGMRRANSLLTAIAASRGLPLVDWFGLRGLRPHPSTMRHDEERGGPSDECMRTHWPYWAIVEQANSLLATALGAYRGGHARGGGHAHSQEGRSAAWQHPPLADVRCANSTD